MNQGIFAAAAAAADAAAAARNAVDAAATAATAAHAAVVAIAAALGIQIPDAGAAGAAGVDHIPAAVDHIPAVVFRQYPAIENFPPYPFQWMNQVNIRPLFRKRLSRSDATFELRLTGADANMTMFHQDVIHHLGQGDEGLKYDNVILHLVRATDELIGSQSIWLRRKNAGRQLFYDWCTFATVSNINLEMLITQEIC